MENSIFERLEELERRINQIVVRGKIAEVNPRTQRARVSYGLNDKHLTAWLPWKPIRAGKATVWWCPELGEGVTVISNGDLTQGEIFPGSYYDQFPSPSQDPSEFAVHFGDGSFISHHRDNHTLRISNAGDVVVEAQKNITINTVSDTTIHAQGDVKLHGHQIKLNDGHGVVTGGCICHFTGQPHADVSQTVLAGK